MKSKIYLNLTSDFKLTSNVIKVNYFLNSAVIASASRKPQFVSIYFELIFSDKSNHLC